MEGVIFCGIQASGKSTFYKENFFESHLRISMDLLNTRNKETQFIDKCIELHQRLVIDNTNPTIAERLKYISKLKQAKYKITGYYFEVDLASSLARNNDRVGKEKINEIGLFATLKKLQVPNLAEGFDELYKVSLDNDRFICLKMKDEI